MPEKLNLNEIWIIIKIKKNNFSHHKFPKLLFGKCVAMEANKSQAFGMPKKLERMGEN
jgi:hypothetical protein